MSYQPLIYKMRIQRSSDPRTKFHNSNYIKYIGEREHSLKAAEKNSNALFGVINNNYSNNLVMRQIQKRVFDLSERGVTIFNSYISFTPEAARTLELTSEFERWERYVKYHISTLQTEHNIDVSSFEYVAAVHLKQGQPHIHISFWDANQKVGINYVVPQKSDAVRKKLIHDTFKNELDYYYQISNEAMTEMKTLTADMLTDLHLHETDITGLDELGKMYDEIYNTLPKTGRLAFSLLPKETKTLIVELIKKMSTSYPAMYDTVRQYFFGEQKAAEMFDSSDSNKGSEVIRQKMHRAAATMYNRIGNIILRQMAKEKKERGEQENKKNRQINAVENLCLSIIRLLRNDNVSANTNNLIIGKELSAQAKKDFALRNKDKGQER